MHVRHALVVIACCVSVTACGKDAPPGAIVLGPVNSIRVVTFSFGVGPGGVGQFTLTAFYADGTSGDVSARAAWFFDASIVQPQGEGRFVGRKRGETAILARYSNMNRSREVIVLPEGTFRVTGRVYEPGRTYPIGQAHISVNDGAGGSLTADADSSGFFTLYGVPPSAVFVVSHVGHETQSRHMELSEHSTITLELPLAGPRLEFSGTYTVVFDWRACSGRVRLAEPRRVYTAVVTQAGPTLDVRFTDGVFAVNSASRGNMMQGQIDAARITLYAQRGSSYYYYGPSDYPFLVERLPDDSRLVVSGTATLLPSGASFSGEFKGFLEIYERSYPGGMQAGNCRDAALSFSERL